MVEFTPGSDPAADEIDALGGPATPVAQRDGAAHGRLALTCLQPGDRCILAVSDWPVGRRAEEPTVSRCGRCARRHPVGDDRLVLLWSSTSDVPLFALVCAPCAWTLTPFRLVLDTDRLADAGSSPTVRAVASLVTVIGSHRADADTGRLCIRAADVHQLAGDLGLTRTHLALRLDDVGVLAGVDPGTSLSSDRTATA